MAMAVVCSFTNYSHLKIILTNTNALAYTSSSYSCSTVQYEDDTLAISSQVDVGLASSCEMDKLLDIRLFDEVSLRRKRKGKRTIGLEYYCIDNDDKVEINVCVDDKKGEEHLTSKEEAKFSWYLKERAKIESVRMSDKDGHELVSSQWANAMGISERNLDKILCNGRLSEERINRCYKRFVISIASSYQGKGLSLKDLTQEGSIGFLRGAIKFNPEKGYKLSTYAYW